MKLQDKLKQHRNQLGLTHYKMRALDEKIGVSSRTWRRLENGGEPTLDTIRKLQIYLGVLIDPETLEVKE